MDKLWSDDVEDAIYRFVIPEDANDNFDDVKSNEGDKSWSYGSESEKSSKIGRNSRRESQSDVSVLSRSDGSKSFSRFSHDKETTIGSALREAELLHLLSDSGFPMTQVNGQRKLGPPPGWTKPPPDPSCEIFVGKIPRTLYEYEIYPIFLKIGEIYELRLMMDFSGTNRGYCFVMFTKFQHAQRAVRELDNYEIRPGRRIGVVASINNCRLCIGQIPSDVESEDIIDKFYEMTDEVNKVAIYKNMNGQIRCALVSYKTHRGAAMARRRLLPERGNLFPDCEVSIDWAHPDMSLSNVVEESGVRDNNGKLEISTVKIGPLPKRGGLQRRGRHDFLDKSIKNYLQEKIHSYNQRKSPDVPLARMQRSLGRGNSYPTRRRGGRGSSQSRKYSNPAPRGRGLNRENHDNRSRSLPASPNEDYAYPSSRDINGNIAKTKNLQQVNGDFFAVDNSSEKIQNDAAIVRSARGVNPLANNFTPAKSSFNLFEHYSQSTERRFGSIATESNYDPLQSSISWGGSVPNFFRNREIRSDGDIKKNQINTPEVPERCANFAEFGKWNSTESFVPKVAVSVSMQQNDGESKQKEVNDIPNRIKIDTSKATNRNQRKIFKNSPDIENRSKNTPRVLNQITNWNGRFNANTEIPRRCRDSDNNRTNSSTKENAINCYPPPGSVLRMGYAQECSGNCCHQCVNHFAMIQRYMQFSGGIAVQQQHIVPYNSTNYWRVSNGAMDNTAASIVDRGRPLTNFPPQSVFPTSAFADPYRGVISQRYTGNNQIACRPRPILNRLAGRVGDD